MAYIGNAKTPLIFASNTRDDLTPELLPSGEWKSEFLLSQEVPGGYESNIMVLARRMLSDVLVTNSTSISIEKVEDVTEVSGYKTLLTTSDPHLAAALNVLLPPISFYEGDIISIQSDVAANNNKTARVLSKTYTGSSIEIALENSDLVGQIASSLTITRLSYAPWEVLEPERDYQLKTGNSHDEQNRIIDFTTAPKEGDVIYVLHRGEATYNFVPSPKSVGPDQLQENLRDFLCDRYVVEDVAGQTEFDLSREAINSKSLFVTVDGQLTDGDDQDVGYQDGDWTLSTDRKSIVFKQTLPQNSKIKILHLGFSTISRKSNISAGQVNIPERSIKTIHLDFNSVISNRLANGSVTTTKIADDAVTGTKFLLNNNEALRAKNSSGTSRELLKLTSGNILEIKNADSNVNITGTSNVNIYAGTQSVFSVATSNKVGIGTTSPSSMLHLRGSVPVIRLTDSDTSADSIISASSTTGSLLISVDDANLIQNSTLTVRVDGSDAMTVLSNGNVGIGTTSPEQKLHVQGTVKATNLETSTINNVSVDNIGVPSGSIIMHGSDLAPSGWLLCDGTTYNGSNATYQGLFQAIGLRYGGSGTSFRVPDLRKRFAIGQAADLLAGTNDGLSVETRSIAHNHSGPAHTHNITHTHSIPGHTHAMVSDASTLAITSTTSGYHTTSLAHTHLNVQTGDTNLTHYHDYTHSHGTYTTTKDGKDHYHTGSTGSNEGGHSHNVKRFGVTNGNYGVYAVSSGTDVSITGGGHSHSVRTGGALNDSFSGEDAYKHDHSVTISDTNTKTTGKPVASDGTTEVSLNHKHSIGNIALSDTNSSSFGYHTHASADFTGSIGYSSVSKTTSGNITQGSTTAILSNTTNLFIGSVITSSQYPAGTTIVGISGNTITTSSGASSTITSGSTLTFAAPDGNSNLSTVSQNNSSSGPAVYTENTGTSVSPYLVVNFIIKL